MAGLSPVGRRPILLLRHGSFYTMNADRPRAEAVAVDRTSGRILAVGDDADMRHFSGPLTESLNLKGRTVLPGFIDAHMHLTMYARSRLELDLRGAATLDAAVELVRLRAEQAPAGQWIIGRGWDKNLWSQGSVPSSAPLDAVAPQHPVAFGSTPTTRCGSTARLFTAPLSTPRHLTLSRERSVATPMGLQMACCMSSARLTSQAPP